MTFEKSAQPVLETILRPGQTVAGKYCVDHLIAAGGMAAVWAGTNLRTGKRVALKVILRSFASTPGAEELFRREALAASRVNHPNVVTVFDVVDHATRTCIVMEYLDGMDLGAYFERQGLLGLEESMMLLLPVMRGVAAANAQGVVHRDLKPKNIFLCIGPDGRLITTKILDFGISVIVENAGEERSKTVQLLTHGTPTYMSPEHITGSPNIDERADVYGFGVILFEALAGQAPFVGPPGTELLTRILEEPAPRLTRLRPDISPQVEAIIDRAIAKNPADRFPTLNHLIAALEDQVLPRSPILRSLTPAVGIPIIESGSGPRCLTDPVVRTARRTPSGEHDGGVTKALYVLSGMASPAKDERPSQPAPIQPPDRTPGSAEEQPAPVLRKDLETVCESATDPGPQSAPTSLAPRYVRTSERDSDTASLDPSVEKRRNAPRLLAIAAAVGAISLGVAWLVIPEPRSAREASRFGGPTTPMAPDPVRPILKPASAEPVLPAAAPDPVAETPQVVAPPQAPQPVPEETPGTQEEEATDDASALQPSQEGRMRTTRPASGTVTKGISRPLGRTPGLPSHRTNETASTLSTSPFEPPPLSAEGAIPSAAPSEAPLPAQKRHRAGQLSAEDF